VGRLTPPTPPSEAVKPAVQSKKERPLKEVTAKSFLERFRQISKPAPAPNSSSSSASVRNPASSPSSANQNEQKSGLKGQLIDKVQSDVREAMGNPTEHAEYGSNSFLAPSINHSGLEGNAGNVIQGWQASKSDAYDYGSHSEAARPGLGAEDEEDSEAAVSTSLSPAIQAILLHDLATNIFRAARACGSPLRVLTFGSVTAEGGAKHFVRGMSSSPVPEGMRDSGATGREDDAVAVLVDFDTLVKMGEEVSDLIKAKEMQRVTQLGRKR